MSHVSLMHNDNKQLLEIESNNNIRVNNELPVITGEVLVISGLLLFLEGIHSFFFFKGISNTLVPSLVLACARLSDSIVRTYQKEQSENKTRTTWERRRWRREKWEREPVSLPVSISLTSLFRPFLSRLDSAVKTVNSSVSYNHSQVSRVSIARDANSLCDVWKFLSSNSLSCESIRFFGSRLEQ